jgi:hypothetical protein
MIHDFQHHCWLIIYTNDVIMYSNLCMCEFFWKKSHTSENCESIYSCIIHAYLRFRFSAFLKLFLTTSLKRIHKLQWPCICQIYEMFHYKTMWFFSHKLSRFMTQVWGKLSSFIHYNIQKMLFIMAYITLNSNLTL